MTHCRDCRDFFQEDGQWGICDRARSRGGEPIDKASLAFACDAEHYAAYLEVNEMFGCIQWEAK